MPQTRVYGTENGDNIRAGGDGTNIYYALAGNDTVIGTDTDLDVIFGGDGNDSLIGASGDYVIGGAGNDSLSGTYVSGGAGNDYITSSNFVQFSGTRASYSISTYGSGTTAVSYVYDIRSGSPDGYDTIVGASNLTFSDTSDFANTSTTVSDTLKTTVYRFYNTKSETHFYTTSTSEVDFIRQNLPTYTYEGPRFNVPTSTSAANAKPMYRFYNTVSESHFFTFDESERDLIIASQPDFNFEGVGMYGYTNNAVDGCEEMYRFYNESTGRHFFTTSEDERDFVLQNLTGYRFEGLAGWVFA